MKTTLRFLFFIAPFPIFIDGAELSFFIFFPPMGDLDAMQNTKPGIPLPLVVFTVAGLFFTSVFGQLGKTLGMEILCKKCWRLTSFLILMTLLPFIYLGVNVLTFIQIYLALFLIAAISIIKNRKFLNACASSYLFGVGIWLSLHAFSMFYHNDFSLIKVDRNWNFSTFFGMYIYQSLVSYSALMSLFTIFSIFMYLEENKGSIALLTIILSGVIGFISETRLFVLDYIFIMIMVLFFYKSSVRKFSIGLRKLVVIVVGLMIWLYGATFYTNRIVTKGSSDRIELISMGVKEIIENPSLIFWGAGLKHSYAHNFFIDFILNYGLIYLIVFLLLFIYSICKIASILNLSKNGFVYCLMLILIVITNSTFNSAITQPLFMANVMIIATIITSYMARRNDSISMGLQIKIR